MSTEPETQSLEDWKKSIDARLEDMERRLDEMEMGDFLLTRKQRIHLVIKRVAESYYIRPSRAPRARRDMNTVEAKAVTAWILMEDFGLTRSDLHHKLNMPWKNVQYLVNNMIPTMLHDRESAKRAKVVRERILKEIPPC